MLLFEVNLVNCVSETSDFVTAEAKCCLVHSIKHVTQLAGPTVKISSGCFRTNMAIMAHLNLTSLFIMKLA